jgi:hypothetical protein
MRLINKDLNVARLLENDRCFWKTENLMQVLHFNKEFFYMNIILVDKSVIYKETIDSARLSDTLQHRIKFEEICNKS